VPVVSAIEVASVVPAIALAVVSRVSAMGAKRATIVVAGASSRGGGDFSGGSRGGGWYGRGRAVDVAAVAGAAAVAGGDHHANFQQKHCTTVQLIRGVRHAFDSKNLICCVTCARLQRCW
jgi:hypothetical protein